MTMFSSIIHLKIRVKAISDRYGRYPKYHCSTRPFTDNMKSVG